MWEFLVDFLWCFAKNGVISLIVALFAYLVLAILLFISMIPLHIILGEDAVKKTVDFARDKLGYRFVYVIVFVPMFLWDYFNW